MGVVEDIGRFAEGLLRGGRERAAPRPDGFTADKSCEWDWGGLCVFQDARVLALPAPQGSGLRRRPGFCGFCLLLCGMRGLEDIPDMFKI